MTSNPNLEIPLRILDHAVRVHRKTGQPFSKVLAVTVASLPEAEHDNFKCCRNWAVFEESVAKEQRPEWALDDGEFYVLDEPSGVVSDDVPRPSPAVMPGVVKITPSCELRCPIGELPDAVGLLELLG